MKIPVKTWLVLSTVAFALAIFTPLVFAATNSTITPTPTSTPATLSVLDLVVGAASGAFYGLLGYYTDKEKNPTEAFNQKQFLLTVGVGAVVGIFIPITAPTDLSGLVGTATTAFGTFGAVYFVQKLITIAHVLYPVKPVATTTTP